MSWWELKYTWTAKSSIKYSSAHQTLDQFKKSLNMNKKSNKSKNFKVDQKLSEKYAYATRKNDEELFISIFSDVLHQNIERRKIANICKFWSSSAMITEKSDEILREEKSLIFFTFFSLASSNYYSRAAFILNDSRYLLLS